jgi:WXG100 family type VII secretion target
MSINFAALQQASDDLAAHHKAIQAHLEALEAELESRLAHWDGAAKEAYYQVKQQWRGAAAHMHGVLIQAQTHLSNANDTYQAVEAGNVGIWQ